TIAAGMQKAVRSLELEVDGLRLQTFKDASTTEIETIMKEVDDRRFFAIFELMHRGYSKEVIHEQTQITMLFLEEIKRLVDLQKAAQALTIHEVSTSTLLALKQAGFTNTWLAYSWDCTKKQVEKRLDDDGIHANY